jgi:hypothetical protein
MPSRPKEKKDIKTAYVFPDMGAKISLLKGIPKSFDILKL